MRRSRPRAFTLVEIVISMVIVSVMLVAVLGTVGASQAIQFKGARQSEALLLAEDLMAEILRMPYEDPDQAPGMGPEAGEATGDRSKFDDVDDYIAWSRTPPEYKSGAAVAWATRYRRDVSVKWVDPDDLTQMSVTETGVKWVQVKVIEGAQTVVALEAVRASSVVDPVDATGREKGVRK